jgi:hypothetical protein
VAEQQQLQQEHRLGWLNPSVGQHQGCPQAQAGGRAVPQQQQLRCHAARSHPCLPQAHFHRSAASIEPSEAAAAAVVAGPPLVVVCDAQTMPLPTRLLCELLPASQQLALVALQPLLRQLDVPPWPWHLCCLS